MHFSEIRNAIDQQLKKLDKAVWYTSDVSKDEIWDTYINSFPEGTNPIYKTRTQHDCNCCKNFIRNIGKVVAIVDGKKVSVWDVQVGGPYQVVVDALSALIHSKPISNQFLTCEPSYGVRVTHSQTETGVKTWDHFYCKVPNDKVEHKDTLGTKLGSICTQKDLFVRGLTTISDEALSIVQDLIAQNSLYRGAEFLKVLQSFAQFKNAYDALKSKEEKEIFVWSKMSTNPGVLCIRNSVIGTLLVDLSEGADLDAAVRSYEFKVAPANYKRPTALITKSMIESAKKTLQELGYENALERRYATLNDITVNNILFVDRSIKSKLGGDIFDDLVTKVPEKVKNLDKVEEVPVETFLKDILPKATSLEVMVENKHSGNMVSLIAPAVEDAPKMFKWPNSFSWSYTGDLADSVKERVKAAGGNVEGDLRCSLSWFNLDDLDIWMLEPGGHKIYFGNRRSMSPNGGMLDVDMNGADGKHSREAVENILYKDRSKMCEGEYVLGVHNYRKRESVDVGFEMQIEFDGVIHTLAFPKALANNSNIEVARIVYSKQNGFSFKSNLESSQSSKQIWNITSNTFRKANIVMLSPNCWDDNVVGNKHYFFMLDGCQNDGQARGFFNEYLSNELTPHRKVFEVIGSKMKTDQSDQQLSGLGFSSTQRNSVLCRVSGSFNRVVRVTF